MDLPRPCGTPVCACRHPFSQHNRLIVRGFRPLSSLVVRPHQFVIADFLLDRRPGNAQESFSGIPLVDHALSDASNPTWRARSLSVYRFWRDLGYAIGALSAGLIADSFGLASAINAIAALTFISGAVAGVLMRKRS